MQGKIVPDVVGWRVEGGEVVAMSRSQLQQHPGSLGLHSSAKSVRNSKFGPQPCSSFSFSLSLCVEMYPLDRRRNLIVSPSAPQTVMNFFFGRDVSSGVTGEPSRRLTFFVMTANCLATRLVNIPRRRTGCIRGVVFGE